MTAQSRSKFVTTDLILASYLVHAGCSPELDRSDRWTPKRPHGAWEFARSETTQALIDRYEEGTAAVEPKSFHLTLTQTRRDMFAFLKVGSERS